MSNFFGISPRRHRDDRDHHPVGLDALDLSGRAAAANRAGVSSDGAAPTLTLELLPPKVLPHLLLRVDPDALACLLDAAAHGSALPFMVRWDEEDGPLGTRVVAWLKSKVDIWTGRCEVWRCDLDSAGKELVLVEDTEGRVRLGSPMVEEGVNSEVIFPILVS